MKNQLLTNIERTLPALDQSKGRGARLRTNVRAGLTVPKLDGSSKDAAYFDIGFDAERVR
jgi:hypothetical protein